VFQKLGSLSGNFRRAWTLFRLPLIFVAAGLAATSLGGYADRHREAEVLLVQLQVAAEQLSVAETDAVGEGLIRPQIAAEAAQAHADLARVLDSLDALNLPSAGLDDVRGSLADYRAGVDRELELVASGDAEAAEQLKSDVTEPAELTLDAAFDDAIAAYGRGAERANALADGGTLLIVVLAGGVVVLLMRRSSRAMQASARLKGEQAALGRSEARFRALVQNGAELVAILTPDGALRYCSSSAEVLLGVSTSSLIDTPLLLRVHPEDHDAVQTLLDSAAADASISHRAEFRVLCSDGSWLHLEGICRDMRAEPDIAGLVLNARDVTERKRLESELAHRAYYDALTELPNRALLVDRLGQALARTSRSGRPMAVLFIDLDGFKLVNDGLGHQLGDQLLTVVGQRLRACLRGGDTAARLGGDEFVILLENLASPEIATSLARRTLDALSRPIVLNSHEVFVGASVGLAVTTGADAIEPDELLRRADLAMYEAKKQGAGRIAQFDLEMAGRSLERLELDADLRRALDREEFCLYYQPIVELPSGRINGVEALLRWCHPQRGLIPPMEFLPLAEQSGVIVPICRWVLNEACRQARVWTHHLPYGTPFVMSVNLSGRQFQDPHLVDDVAAALRDSQLPPERLKLEVTESTAVETGIGAIQTLQALKGLGVLLAIDDFGTGYSSLSYLKHFRVDTLKVDRSFIEGMEHDPQDVAIVKSVVALARSLDLSVTAEGVETPEQLELLNAIACDEAQGYLFARPQPADSISALLTSQVLQITPSHRAA
jgi:diguanylate cyclase (GGDEF)-like protein/PAS domain S-box-containing protein